MSGFKWDRKSEEYAIWQARVCAVKAAIPFQLSRAEREDIISDLLLDLVERVSDYDATRASQRTFIARVIQNEYRDICDSLAKGKRAFYRRAASLNAPRRDDSDPDAEFGDTISQQEYRTAMTGVTQSFEEELDDRVEIGRRLAGISEDLRDLAEDLASRSVSAISRSRGVSRARVRREVKDLRKAMKRPRR